MNRYKKFIKKGVSEQISKIPFHNYAPIKRLSMLSKKRFPSSNTHVAVHFVTIKNIFRDIDVKNHGKEIVESLKKL